MSAHWYPLGLQLKVRISTLDGIRVQFQNPRDQLLEMLKVWLTTGDNTSWTTLTDALRSRSVGASQLAGVLETKYCLVERTEVDSGTSTSESKPETTVSPPAQPTTSQLLVSATPSPPYPVLPPPPLQPSPYTGDTTSPHTNVTMHPLQPTPIHTGMSPV